MASASGTDFADGSVHSLSMGTTELRMILEAASQHGQLVVVDFSAKWCGPCKMMVPILQKMAGEHRGKVVFCKVDCEETPHNHELAQEAGISAFPTFHVYRALQRVAEFRGANPPQLQQAIRQQLPLLAPPAPTQQPQQQHATAGTAGAAGAAPTSAAPGPMAIALAQALARVRSSCSFDEFVAAARTLLTFVSNVLAHPQESKYRRIRLSNAAFQSKLGTKPGGTECMAALGFQERQGEGVLVMDAIPQELAQVKALLETAIPGGREAGAAAPAAPAPASAGAGEVRPWTAGGAATGGSTAGASNVDPAALARALAAAMGGGAAPPTDTGTGAAVAPSGSRPAPVGGGGAGGQPRVLRLTPAKLARMLEKVLLDGGFGAPGP